MRNWINSDTNENNIVLSSRIRLARNLASKPFPDKLDYSQGREVVKAVEDAFYSSTHTEKNFKTNYLWDLDEISRNSFFERHLISLKLLKNFKEAAFIIDNDDTISIMINEEDHIRLQCITEGLNLEEAYDWADKLDNLLEEKLEYAYDEKLGYLSACPTNVGTGLRASVMVHLPALTLNNEMNKVLNAVTQVGMTIRGLYGEGTKAEGNLYQISNQLTLGLSEEDVINNLKAVVNQIINQENWSRERLLKNYKNELEDKIYRSLGILKSAILLDSKECLNLLSNVRMGLELGILKDIGNRKLNSLLVETQPASLQSNSSAAMSDRDRDLIRAKLVRERLK